MVKKWIIVLVVIALGVGGYVLLRPSEEKKIRKRFDRLTDLLDKSDDEGTIAAAGKAKAIADLFATPVRVTGAPFDLSGSYGAQELMGVVMHGRARSQSLDADILDLEIRVEGENTAWAHFTAQVTGTVSGERAREVREVRCRLTKTEGEWFIGQVEMVEVMRR